MKTLILGIGNDSAGDDGIGPAVVREMRTRMEMAGNEADSRVELRTLPYPDPARLDDLRGFDTLVIVDAVLGDDEPGTIHRMKWQPDSLADKQVQRTSTHGFGVREWLQMGAALGKLPGRVWLFGIEVASVAPGDELSSPVQAALSGLVDELGRMVRLGIRD